MYSLVIPEQFVCKWTMEKFLLWSQIRRRLLFHERLSTKQRHNEFWREETILVFCPELRTKCKQNACLRVPGVFKMIPA